MNERTLRALAGLGAAFYLVIGIWALVAPRSFFDVVASYPPYSKHLIHDLGAFSAGVGAGLAGGLFRLSGLGVALTGGAAASVLHAVSHWMDRGEGGRASDPYTLSILALGAVAAAVLAVRNRGGA